MKKYKTMMKIIQLTLYIWISDYEHQTLHIKSSNHILSRLSMASLQDHRKLKMVIVNYNTY